MKSSALHISLALAAALVFGGVAWFGYQQATVHTPAGSIQKLPDSSSAANPANGGIPVKIYQITDKGIVESQRSIANETAAVKKAELLIAEFLKLLPRRAEEPKLLAVFRDRENRYYIDISSAVAVHAIGDTAREYQFLRALVLTLTTNIQGVEEVQILIDGKETSTLGGHILLTSSLRELTQDDLPR